MRQIWPKLLKDKVVNILSSVLTSPPLSALRNLSPLLPHCPMTACPQQVCWRQPIRPHSCWSRCSSCRRRSRAWRQSFYALRRQRERPARESAGQILHNTSVNMFNSLILEFSSYMILLSFCSESVFLVWTCWPMKRNFYSVQWWFRE